MPEARLREIQFVALKIECPSSANRTTWERHDYQTGFARNANDSPEMLRAYRQVVNAIVEYRKEVAAIEPGLRTTVRFKQRQFAATLKLIQFANSIVFNGRPLSQEDRKLVRHWIAEAVT